MHAHRPHFLALHGLAKLFETTGLVARRLNPGLSVSAVVLTLCDAMGDRTDQEMEEVYSALRRRPDGRSLGLAHDFLWQISALLLGRYRLSQTEFEALIGALVRSTRKWSERPVSRNYIDYLRQTFGQAHSSSIMPQ